MTTYTLHDLRTDPRWALPDRVECGTRCVCVDDCTPQEWWDVGTVVTMCAEDGTLHPGFQHVDGRWHYHARSSYRLAPPDYTGLQPDAPPVPEPSPAERVLTEVKRRVRAGDTSVALAILRVANIDYVQRTTWTFSDEAAP